MLDCVVPFRFSHEVRMSRATLMVFAAAAVLGCATQRPNSEVAPGGMGGPGEPAMMMAGRGMDPIGELLEERDSLKLADSVVQQLVQLNLRLFGRNAPLRIRLDSMFATTRIDPRAERGDTMAISPEMRGRIAPTLAQLREQTDAARDTALALLTPQQRERAQTLAEQRQRRMRGGNDMRRPR
jgi:hypothetical protein